MINILTFGSKHFLGQLPMITQAFKDFGYNVDSDLNIPELIYSNDLGGYNDAYLKWIKFNKIPKLIFNVLDLPFHVNEFNQVLEKYRYFLQFADKITTISYKVKKDIKNYLNLDADVIYQPIRDVSHIPNVKKQIDFFINGRVLDPNKRGFLALQLAQNTNKMLVCTGSDYIVSKYNKVYNYGVVSDLELSYIYNRSYISLAFGKIEGLGMQIIESLICKTPIITLSDNLTNFEFCPLEMICESDINDIIEKANDIFDKYDYYLSICNKYSEKYSTQFSPKQIAQNILNVYESIV